MSSYGRDSLMSTVIVLLEVLLMSWFYDRLLASLVRLTLAKDIPAVIPYYTIYNSVPVHSNTPCVDAIDEFYVGN